MEAARKVKEEVESTSEDCSEELIQLEVGSCPHTHTHTHARTHSASVAPPYLTPLTATDSADSASPAAASADHTPLHRTTMDAKQL